MNKSVFIKTTGLLYITVAAFGAAVAGILWRFFEFNIVIAIAIVLAAAVPVTAVMFAVMMNGEKHSKFGRLYMEFKQELVSNGYSERFLQITEEVVDAHRKGEKISKVYLKDFILYACDYYNLVGDYSKALSLISNLNEFDYTGKSDTFIDYGLSAMMYYSSLMDTYRGLNDKAGASGMIGRARPFLDKNYKFEVMNMGAEAIYYNYCMLIEDYERAGEYVKKLSSYTSDESKKYYVRYYIEAEYDMHLGRREEAAAALKKMEPVLEKAGDLKLALEFCYNRYWNLLGLREPKQE